MYEKYIKRLLSIVISSIGIILMLPMMIIIGLLIKLEDKGSIIFKQKRLGKNEKEFTIYKFRSMVENAYEIGGLVSSESDVRITRIGRILRKTSADELPQLFNILKGDMCIIGPRPILKNEFDEFKYDFKYNNYQRRYDVLPGLFCTVDIEHRATASRELQFEMDVEYVDNMSIVKDFNIFFKTLINVIKQKNVYKNSEYNKSSNN